MILPMPGHQICWAHCSCAVLGFTAAECLLQCCFNYTSSYVSGSILTLPSAAQVFDAKDWDALVMRSIVPKLAWALQDVLVINPLQQDLAPFHWLTAWHAVLPQHHMVNLLEFRFFPAWHRVLQHWLSNHPDFDEVTRWYMGWKVLLHSSALHCMSISRVASSKHACFFVLDWFLVMLISVLVQCGSPKWLFACYMKSVL